MFVIAKKWGFHVKKKKVLLYWEGHSLKASEGLEDKKKGPKKVGRNRKKHDVWTWWKYGRCVKKRKLAIFKDLPKVFLQVPWWLNFSPLKMLCCEHRVAFVSRLGKILRASADIYCFHSWCYSGYSMEMCAKDFVWQLTVEIYYWMEHDSFLVNELSIV